MPNQERIEYLFQRYLTRMETPEELEELMDVIESGDQKAAIEQLFDKAQQGVDRSVRLNDEQTERLYHVISLQSGVAPVIPITRWRKWRQVSVAAAIVVALSVGGYFIFFHGNRTPANEVATVQPVMRDVEAPKAPRATITLADGRTISLDSLTAIAQDKVQLTKTADGTIMYSGNAVALAYNTLTNPRGSQAIDITLSDGSKVWLNAGSSITYPVAFIGNERKVAITGEAYFEIAHDKTKPFYVSKGAMQVQVLGTHFNVNAYDDETAAKVTLLEGSVKVMNGQTAILKPGEQAILTHDARLTIAEPDLDVVMAWKNGLFEFNETDIQTVMKQLEKWYDVQVVFDGAFTQHFNGTIQRQVNISKVLNMLEKTGGLRFSIAGKKVLVKKY
jgi:ferric-dicitrate binding protein FerR (iron transport regulator)